VKYRFLTLLLAGGFAVWGILPWQTGQVTGHPAGGFRKAFGYPGSFFNLDQPAAKPLMVYHGGPLMLGTNSLYIIYYGAFGSGQNATVTIINDFFSNIGGSGNYNVNTTYYDSNDNHIINSLSFSPLNNTYIDHYSIGKKIGGKGIERIVQAALAGGHLPVETSAIYFVVTAPDVTGPEIGGGTCAFHASSSKLAAGVTIIYSAIPDFGGKQLNACDGNVQIFNETNSPNNNLGADDALDSFMHELSESVTDPLGNAWWGPKGEVGDICNFNYGTTYIAPNGTHANTHLGTRDYLVQTIWENTGAGFCANSL